MSTQDPGAFQCFRGGLRIECAQDRDSGRGNDEQTSVVEHPGGLDCDVAPFARLETIKERDRNHDGNRSVVQRKPRAEISLDESGSSDVPARPLHCVPELIHADHVPRFRQMPENAGRPAAEIEETGPAGQRMFEHPGDGLSGLLSHLEILGGRGCGLDALEQWNRRHEGLSGQAAQKISPPESEGIPHRRGNESMV